MSQNRSKVNSVAFPEKVIIKNRKGLSKALFKQADYVIIGVSDMTRSVNFYHKILGLPLRFEDKEWSEFETGKTTIALHPAAKRRKAYPGFREYSSSVLFDRFHHFGH